MAEGASKASVITRPDWAQKPTAEQMLRFYPERAQFEHQDGRATIQCLVSAAGGLNDCAVIDETPKDYGFGNAALSLSAMFRMKSQTTDGVAVEGGSVTIPIIFDSPTPRSTSGDTAAVLTKITPSMPPPSPDTLVMRCPHSADQCQGHFLKWTERPNKAQTARILAETKPDDFGTGALCAITEDGALKDCEFLGYRAPGNVAAAREVVKLLRAPKTTDDGLNTADATVLVDLDWSWYAAWASRPDKP